APGVAILDADDGDGPFGDGPCRPTAAAGTPTSSTTPPPSAVSPGDPFFICYTSGTTGHPKGAVLTHESWFYASMVRALQGGINKDDRILLPFPLAFTGGLALALVALWTGARLVLEPAFEPGRALQLIESERISVFMAVPTL